MERIKTLHIILELILSMQLEYTTTFILLSLFVPHHFLLVVEAGVKIELQSLELVPEELDHLAYVAGDSLRHLQLLHLVVLVHTLHNT